MNPFSLKNSEIPSNLLLMAKLIALGLLLKGYLHQMSDHFIPLIPIFDFMGPPFLFEMCLKILFVLSAVGIIFNYHIRTCCIILGLVFIIVPLSSIVSYRNAKVFCGFILLLTGLHKKGDVPWLVRYQVAIVYLGAGINKLFDVDWQTGQYFEYWMHHIIENHKYIWLASHLPEMLLSKIMCWSTIIGEIAMSVALLNRRYCKFAIWAGVCFHVMALVLTWQDFGIFTIAILASYLCFVRWPHRIQLFYNPNKSGHIFLRNVLTKLNFDRVFNFHDSAHKQLVITIRNKEYGGFVALKKIILYTPFFYFAMVILLSGTQGYVNVFQIRMVEVIFILFIPVLEILKKFKLM